MSRPRRRDRVPAPPAAPPLSRDAVLEAGLRIARREDLGRLTLKKLADEFGVTPMALYRHFRSKAEIVDGVLDRFVREAAVTTRGPDVAPGDWRGWLRRTFGNMRRSLRETPGVLPLLTTEYRFGPGAMAVLDEVLGVLREAGLSDREAVEAFLALASYTLGAAGIEAAWQRPLEPDPDDSPRERQRRLRARFESASRARHPSIVALAPALAQATGDFPFERGLDGLLDGLGPHGARR